MALFRKFAKRVLIGTCTATGNFIGYVISTIKMYALLTKHEVKKQDSLRFMVRKFPIVFTLIWGGNRMGDNPSTDFAAPTELSLGTLPGLASHAESRVPAKEAIPAVVAPCERNCSSAQLS